MIYSSTIKWIYSWAIIQIIARYLPYNILREYFGLRRPKKQEEVEECIMRILTITTLNPYREAVGYVGDVSEKLSAQIFGFSVYGQNILQLKKQNVKRRCRNWFCSVCDQIIVVNTALFIVDSVHETSQRIATRCEYP